MSWANPPTSRRAALGGALAGLTVVAGCDDGGGTPAEPVPGASSGAADTIGPAADPDVELVGRVTAQVLEALATVTAARRRDRSLRRTLRPLASMHQAHLAELSEDPGAPETVDGVRARLRDVRAAESRLQRQLTDAAVAAESGALAKLLASMAAAVAQHRAVLP